MYSAKLYYKYDKMGGKIILFSGIIEKERNVIFALLYTHFLFYHSFSIVQDFHKLTLQMLQLVYRDKQTHFLLEKPFRDCENQNFSFDYNYL